jgi:hypothetical protein
MKKKFVWEGEVWIKDIEKENVFPKIVLLIANNPMELNRFDSKKVRLTLEEI